MWTVDANVRVTTPADPPWTIKGSRADNPSPARAGRLLALFALTY